MVVDMIHVCIYWFAGTGVLCMWSWFVSFGCLFDLIWIVVLIAGVCYRLWLLGCGLLCFGFVWVWCSGLCLWLELFVLVILFGCCVVLVVCGGC